MFPIVLLIIAIMISCLFNFPGGPTGFATYVSLWIKRKLARHFDEPVERGLTINRYDGRQRASWTFHPRQRQEQ